jgi:hypothetical protein
MIRVPEIPNQIVRCGPVLAILLLASTHLHGQSSINPVRVRWSLMDLVLVPDTVSRIRVLVAPNAHTTAWAKGSQIVHFTVDPVALLQWASAAQALTNEAEISTVGETVLFTATPRLHGRSARRFMTLARALKRVPDNQRLQLLVIDSICDIQWKTYATAKEVNQLVTAIEDVVARVPELSTSADSNEATQDRDLLVVDDQESDLEPVVQLKAARPRWPSALLNRPVSGRVWTEYVVGTDGRVQKGSIRIILADREEFAQEAIRALAGATFRPAKRRGTVVPQLVFQAVSFKVGSW